MYLVPNSSLAVSDASQFPRRRLRLGRVPGRRRRMLLGQSSEDFISQAIAPYKGQPFYQHMHDFVASDLAAGVVDNGGNYATGAGVCAGGGGGGQISPATIAASVGTSIVPSIMKAVAPAAAAGPIGAAVVIGSAVVGLFAALFKPHAYTRQETSILCQAVPAGNAVLQQIDQEVQYGTISPEVAIQALSTLYSQFAGAVAPIVSHTSGHYAETGDNAEFVQASLKAIIAARMAHYQTLAQQAAAAPAPASPLETVSTVAQSVTSTAARLGVSPWLLWLVGGFLVLQLV